MSQILKPITVRDLIALLAEENLDDKITMTEPMGYNCDIVLYAGDSIILHQDKTNSTGGDNVYGLFDSKD